MIISNVTFTLRLNKSYGGHISTLLIRHIQVTDQIYKNIEGNNFLLSQLKKDTDGQGYR